MPGSLAGTPASILAIFESSGTNTRRDMATRAHKGCLGVSVFGCLGGVGVRLSRWVAEMEVMQGVADWESRWLISQEDDLR